MTTRISRRARAAFAGALLGATALAGAAAWRPADAQPAPIVAPAVPQAALPGFADLAARVQPAVVTVTTKAAREAAETPFPPGSPQEHLSRRFGGEQAKPRAARGLGSGFLVGADGHVMTNDHVVDGASEVAVTLGDGRELPARVVGRDPRTDLALLKVDAGGALPFLRLGDSDRARPGDWVVAVGNPFGLGGTVTAGIVSARGRGINAGPYDDFLQVDAPINRGNSGGPLFAQDGTVIGVNTAIFSPSGGSVGIGFAIPSNLVKGVVTQLQEKGRVERGYLGASLQPVDRAMADALGLKEARGALVAAVEKGSPAEAAGLRAGDVVTAVGGAPVRNSRELARAVADLEPGVRAELHVHRDGGEQVLAATVAELRDTPVQRADTGKVEGGRLGLALGALTDEARRALALPEGTQGAVVAEVRDGGPAAEAGLRPGDGVTGVGNQAVTGPEGGVRAIRETLKARDGAVALRVLRDGASTFFALRADAEGQDKKQG